MSSRYKLLLGERIHDEVAAAAMEIEISLEDYVRTALALMLRAQHDGRVTRLVDEIAIEPDETLTHWVRVDGDGRVE